MVFDSVPLTCIPPTTHAGVPPSIDMVLHRIRWGEGKEGEGVHHCRAFWIPSTGGLPCPPLTRCRSTIPWLYNRCPIVPVATTILNTDRHFICWDHHILAFEESRLLREVTVVVSLIGGKSPRSIPLIWNNFSTNITSPTRKANVNMTSMATIIIIANSSSSSQWVILPSIWIIMTMAMWLTAPTEFE